MTPPPLRLAILEADKPQPQTRDRYGGYTGLFTSLLSDAAATLSPPETVLQGLSVTGFDIVHDLHTYPSLDDIDAVLITGSHHTAHDNDPWIIRLVDFARRAIATGRVRVVGVCFGHQIVGRAMGARLGRSDKGWEISVTEVNLTDKGRDIFGLNRMVSQRNKIFMMDCPGLDIDKLCSASIRCTATSSSITPRDRSPWAPTTCAPCRACTARAGT